MRLPPYEAAKLTFQIGMEVHENPWSECQTHPVPVRDVESRSTYGAHTWLLTSKVKPECAAAKIAFEPCQRAQSDRGVAIPAPAYGGSVC